LTVYMGSYTRRERISSLGYRLVVIWAQGLYNRYNEFIILQYFHPRKNVFKWNLVLFTCYSNLP